MLQADYGITTIVLNQGLALVKLLAIQYSGFRH
jgi:hypothetical protein